MTHQPDLGLIASIPDPQARHYAATGAVIHLGVLIEGEMSRLFGSAFGDEDVGRKLFGGYASGDRKRAALNQMMTTRAVPEWISISARLGSVLGRDAIRNRVAHRAVHNRARVELAEGDVAISQIYETGEDDDRLSTKALIEHAHDQVGVLTDLRRVGSEMRQSALSRL